VPTTTSKATNAGGGSKKVNGVTGQTTTQLQAALPDGYDPGTWKEKLLINQGLPYLNVTRPQ